MIIREAIKNDLKEAMTFYNIMCEELGKEDHLPDGSKGGFPSEAMVAEAIENKQLYIGKEDGKIMAAYIMNHYCDAAYDTVKWQIDAAKEQISVMHALRVLPQYSGKGYATRLVEHAIEIAKQKKQKAIRLDCLEVKPVPQKMYRAFGFRDIDIVEIYYKDIGEPRKFILFEKVL